MESEENEVVNGEQTGPVVCPNCAARNPEDSDFCSGCGAPLGAYAAIDPMKSIRAQGAFFRQAANLRVGTIGLVVVWALFLAGASVPVVAIAMGRTFPLAGWLGCGVWWAISIAIVAHLTRMWARGRREKRN